MNSLVMESVNIRGRTTVRMGLNGGCKLSAVSTGMKVRGTHSGIVNDHAAANCGGEQLESAAASHAADLHLINQVRMGQKKAFDMLVLKYQNRVTKLISRYVSDQSEVMDIAQETFIKVYRAIPGFRGDSAFYTWLYRIAINAAKNHLISRSRRPPAFDVDIVDAEQFSADNYLKDYGTPEQNLLKDEVVRTVLEAVQELSQDLQVAITLREMDGLSYEEIAVAMDCPVGTVRSRISRAREAIKSRLDSLSLK